MISSVLLLPFNIVYNQHFLPGVFSGMTSRPLFFLHSRLPSSFKPFREAFVDTTFRDLKRKFRSAFFFEFWILHFCTFIYMASLFLTNIRFG